MQNSWKNVVLLVTALKSFLKIYPLHMFKNGFHTENDYFLIEVIQGMGSI